MCDIYLHTRPFSEKSAILFSLSFLIQSYLKIPKRVFTFTHGEKCQKVNLKKQYNRIYGCFDHCATENKGIPLNFCTNNALLQLSNILALLCLQNLRFYFIFCPISGEKLLFLFTISDNQTFLGSFFFQLHDTQTNRLFCSHMSIIIS